jgi:hypothetical protein
MAFIMPTQDQFKQLMAQEYTGPIVMVTRIVDIALFELVDIFHFW